MGNGHNTIIERTDGVDVLALLSILGRKENPLSGVSEARYLR